MPSYNECPIAFFSLGKVWYSAVKFLLIFQPLANTCAILLHSTLHWAFCSHNPCVSQYLSKSILEPPTMDLVAKQIGWRTKRKLLGWKVHGVNRHQIGFLLVKSIKGNFFPMKDQIILVTSVSFVLNVLRWGSARWLLSSFLSRCYTLNFYN